MFQFLIISIIDIITPIFSPTQIAWDVMSVQHVIQ